MASKTKPTDDAALPLDTPAQDQALTAAPGVVDASLPGPDALEQAGEPGVDDGTDGSEDDLAPADQAADPTTDEATSPATIEQVDALLQRLSDADRETLLAKWGVLWIAGGLPEGAQADRDAALEAAASVVDLARLLDEVGARTAGMTGGIVGPGLRRFLEAEGAEISEDDPATVTLGGITASSQFGLSRALLDWCMVATRKIMAGAV